MVVARRPTEGAVKLYSSTRIRCRLSRWATEHRILNTGVLQQSLVTQRAVGYVCQGEKKGAWMGGIRQLWWFIPAGLVGLALVVFGVGNLASDDGGPLYGQIVAFVVFGAAGLVILFGMVFRSRGDRIGSWMIVAGAVPGLASFALFWFPPAWLVGIMSLAVIVAAYRDTREREVSAFA